MYQATTLPNGVRILTQAAQSLFQLEVGDGPDEAPFGGESLTEIETLDSVETPQTEDQTAIDDTVDEPEVLETKPKAEESLEPEKEPEIEVEQEPEHETDGTTEIEQETEVNVEQETDVKVEEEIAVRVEQETELKDEEEAEVGRCWRAGADQEKRAGLH